jgi:hypothetical protein
MAPVDNPFQYAATLRREGGVLLALGSSSVVTNVLKK